VAISLAVGTDRRERLEQRVEELRQAFGTVALHRPLGLQAALFGDHLPRADGGRVRDYADVLTVEQLAALMPVGTHRGGSDRGVVIGRTSYGGHRPVRFEITEASRAGRPPSILLAGTLGSGKTIAPSCSPTRRSGAGAWSSTSTPNPTTTSNGCPSWPAACR
jgi:hypothetical protein